MCQVLICVVVIKMQSLYFHGTLYTFQQADEKNQFQIVVTEQTKQIKA